MATITPEMVGEKTRGGVCVVMDFITLYKQPHQDLLLVAYKPYYLILWILSDLSHKKLENVRKWPP